MKRFATILTVSMAIVFILVPAVFAGSGSPEKPDVGPRGLKIEGAAPGEKLVGVAVIEHYGFYQCYPNSCANARVMLRLRKTNELKTFFTHVEDIVIRDFAGNQEVITEALRPAILSAFKLDPNATIVLRNLEEFVGADDTSSPLAVLIGGEGISTYIFDIVLSVK